MSDVYSTQSQSAPFLKFSKALFAGRLSDLSTDAKVLYSLLLERRGLSTRNDFKDTRNQVYIIYTRAEVMTTFHCGKEKAASLMAELDEHSGVGLIRRVRKGQGNPSFIYVRDIEAVFSKINATPAPEEKAPTGDGSQTSEKPTSRSRINRPLKVGKPDSSKIDKSKTDSNKIENETTLSIDRPDTVQVNEVLPAPIEEPSIWIDDKENDLESFTPLTEINTKKERNNFTQPAIHGIIPEETFTARRLERETTKRLIRSNIDYDKLYVYDSNATQFGLSIDSLLEIMLDTACSTKPYVRVNGEDMPTSVVRDRFLKITEEHINYVQNAFQKNTSIIRNVRGYLITALYNSVATIGAHDVLEKAHDRHLFEERFGCQPKTPKRAIYFEEPM